MTDYFTKNGNYSETLPWKKKSGSSHIEITSLSVAGGVVSMQCQRISMYGDIADTWSMDFAHPDAVDTYKPKKVSGAEKVVPDVVWKNTKPDAKGPEWGQFLDDSNCGRLWVVIMAFLDSHEPNFVPGSDVPESTDPLLKQAAVTLMWKWDQVVELRC